MVKPGNLVAPNETLLTTLVSVDPVYVTFVGDERAYLRYQDTRALGQPRELARRRATPVLVGLANEEGFPHKGEMDFVDNALNPETGTIRARAVVPNPDGVFTPGLFARVRLLGESQTNALLIHEQAVLTDQDRRYVYIVGEKNAAERRDVTLGPIVEGLRVVESGLKPGDKVIINGMRKIFFPGQPVNPHDVPMDQPNLPTPRRSRAAAAKLTRNGQAHRLLADLHRPPDPRDGAVGADPGLGTHGDPEPADQRVPGRRAAVGAGHGELPGRQSAHDRRHRRRPDRGGGQRRREHDLHEVDVELRRPDGADRHVQGRAPTSTSPPCRCRTAWRRPCRACRRRCARSASPPSRRRRP